MNDSGSKVGERLAELPAPEILEYLYRPRLQREFEVGFDHLTAINQAHVVMLADQGILAGEVAATLLRAIAEVAVRGPVAVVLDPALEDAYFNYEREIVHRVGLRIGGSMHTARSRNDLGATLARLRLREDILDVIDAVLDARQILLERGAAYADVVMTGYTHLQPAQPITYGHYLLAIAAALARDTRRLGAAYANTNLSPMGAGALAGTAFPIDRSQVARLLGFDDLVEHTLDAVATRDFAVEAVAALTMFGLTASRFAYDLHVWYSREFGAITLPDRVAGTSSIMPQKKNPVVLEHLKGKPAHLIAALVSMAAAIKGAGYTNTIDGNREAMSLVWDSTEQAKACAVLLRLAAASAVPNRAVLARRAAEDFSVATDLADLLVREAGLSFREAHHVVGGVVRRAVAQGCDSQSLTSGMVDTVAEPIVGRRLGVPDARLRAVLDPIESVDQRRSIGGPSPGEVHRMCAAAAEQLARDRDEQGHRRDRLQEAAENLATRVAALTAS